MNQAGQSFIHVSKVLRRRNDLIPIYDLPHRVPTFWMPLLQSAQNAANFQAVYRALFDQNREITPSVAIEVVL